jgi:hypothetical protein
MLFPKFQTDRPGYQVRKAKFKMHFLELQNVNAQLPNRIDQIQDAFSKIANIIGQPPNRIRGRQDAGSLVRHDSGVAQHSTAYV